MKSPIHVVFTGPECSGKTTLSSWLCTELDNSVLLDECARDYLIQLNRPYNLEDIWKLAAMEYDRFMKFEGEYDWIIHDTSLVVLAIWLKDRFDGDLWSNPSYIHLMSKVDIFLLCKPDIPWIYDPLRENPNDRMRLYDLYKEELTRFGWPFHEICGDLYQRQNRIYEIISQQLRP